MINIEIVDNNIKKARKARYTVSKNISNKVP